MIFSETELQSRSQHPGFVGGENPPGQGELNFTHSRKVAGVNGWAGRGVGPPLLAYGHGVVGVNGNATLERWDLDDGSWDGARPTTGRDSPGAFFAPTDSLKVSGFHLPAFAGGRRPNHNKPWPSALEQHIVRPTPTICHGGGATLIAGCAAAITRWWWRR